MKTEKERKYFKTSDKYMKKIDITRLYKYFFVIYECYGKVEYSLNREQKHWSKHRSTKLWLSLQETFKYSKVNVYSHTYPTVIKVTKMYQNDSGMLENWRGSVESCK